jgi:hypothetical protein
VWATSSTMHSMTFVVIFRGDFSQLFEEDDVPING